MTPKQRRTMLAGKPLFIEAKDEIAPGRYDLERNLSVRVNSVLEIEPGKWRVHYSLHDFRPRLLHANVAYGYTTIPAIAAAGEPEAVSEDEQGEISQEADQQGAYSRSQRRLLEEQRRYQARLSSATGRQAARITFQITRIEGYLEGPSAG